MPVTHNDTECPPNDSYPTIEEFNLALGGGAIALYVLSGIVIVVLAVQYGLLCGHFMRHVPDSRKLSTFWVNSVYLVVAVFTMFSLALPQASDFVWLFYRVYLGMAMGHFVYLTMSWYGGESEMLEQVGHETLVNFRVRPCCLCFCCPGAAFLNKKRIRFLKGAVFQMPYVQGSVLFLMCLLDLAGYLDSGNMSPDQPYFYCILVLTISFFFGLWALFVFFDITKRYNLLHSFQYGKKALTLKTLVILINIQGIIVDIFANYGVIDCIAPHMSAKGVGGVVKSCLCLTESIVLGSITYAIYIKDVSHL